MHSEQIAELEKHLITLEHKLGQVHVAIQIVVHNTKVKNVLYDLLSDLNKEILQTKNAITQLKKNN